MSDLWAKLGVSSSRIGVSRPFEAVSRPLAVETSRLVGLTHNNIIRPREFFLDKDFIMGHQEHFCHIYEAVRPNIVFRSTYDKQFISKKDSHNANSFWIKIYLLGSSNYSS